MFKVLVIFNLLTTTAFFISGRLVQVPVYIGVAQFLLMYNVYVAKSIVHVLLM